MIKYNFDLLPNNTIYLENTNPQCIIQFTKIHSKQFYYINYPTIIINPYPNQKFIILTNNPTSYIISDKEGDVIIIPPSIHNLFITPFHKKKIIKIIKIDILSNNIILTKNPKIILFNWNFIDSVKDYINHFPIIRNIFNILNPNHLLLLVGPKHITHKLKYQHLGPQNFILTLALTTPGTGPASHYHKLTFEHFIIIKGNYVIKIEGKHHRLKPGEIIQIKPNLLRTFRQSKKDKINGLLLPIVLGCNDESKDILFPRSVKNEIIRKIGWKSKIILLILNKKGLKFT